MWLFLENEKGQPFCLNLDRLAAMSLQDNRLLVGDFLTSKAEDFRLSDNGVRMYKNWVERNH